MNNWSKTLQPLLKKYSGKKHPLNYENNFQLLVVVILSAADSDKHINNVAPALFKKYSNMKQLAGANLEDLQTAIKGVTGYRQKAAALIELAKIVKTDKSIPNTMEELSKLPRIGRKTANVIMREMNVKAEGIIVDLHVLRVAPRLGIAKGTKADDIEKQLMHVIPEKNWGESGMAMSFLGREICRPKEPKCLECVMKRSCEYYTNFEQIVQRLKPSLSLSKGAK